ncbi:MAG: COX15/CtaA family protein [Bacteriovoracaceae bacterium]|jgi:cytochrome c oxidase assembly protein subunit 15|nr:heme A synthase [Halobacteriovoraceae bacterium]MDP7322170.1 COX15/CtaA family protein [Bacteriovoracaceae bacterium]
MTNRSNFPLVIWLFVVSVMVFMMVMIGGITRLTDSGLSMVDWKPLMGTIPPLTDQQWQESFEQYKAYPEYKLVNHHRGMKLAEYKQIFFWEYFHRLFGRLIGLAFFFPFVYFWMKKKIPQGFKPKLMIAFGLGALQGLMGWYMVKSGLVNEPDVSHYRLAAHLGLAFLIIAYLYYLILQLSYPQRNQFKKNQSKRYLTVFGVVLFIQIILGAFVAGLDGGLTHNTFPKMGRYWIPNEVFEFVGLDAYLHSTVVVQFIHRLFGWVLFFLSGFMFFLANKTFDEDQRRAWYYLASFVYVQFLLGVMTILYFVPLSIALMHQAGACLLLLFYIRAYFFTTRSK